MKLFAVAGRIVLWRILAVGLLATATAGCSVGYVARAAYEEARFLWRREDIERKLGMPATGRPGGRVLEALRR